MMLNFKLSVPSRWHAAGGQHRDNWQTQTQARLVSRCLADCRLASGLDTNTVIGRQRPAGWPQPLPT